MSNLVGEAKSLYISALTLEELEKEIARARTIEAEYIAAGHKDVKIEVYLYEEPEILISYKREKTPAEIERANKTAEARENSDRQIYEKLKKKFGDT